MADVEGKDDVMDQPENKSDVDITEVDDDQQHADTMEEDVQEERIEVERTYRNYLCPCGSKMHQWMNLKKLEVLIHCMR